MFAGLQRGQRLSGMLRDRAVDMHSIDIRIFQHVFKVRISLGDAKLVAAGIQSGFITTANRVHLGIRMMLINRNEFRTKTQSDNRHANLLRHNSTPQK